MVKLCFLSVCSIFPKMTGFWNWTFLTIIEDPIRRRIRITRHSTLKKPQWQVTTTVDENYIARCEMMLSEVERSPTLRHQNILTETSRRLPESLNQVQNANPSKITPADGKIHWNLSFLRTQHPIFEDRWQYELIRNLPDDNKIEFDCDCQQPCDTSDRPKMISTNSAWKNTPKKTWLQAD